jgi:hypothetical protein
MKNADMPAMPCDGWESKLEGGEAIGLSKREEVASRVLAGFASRMDASDADYAVAWAIGWADAFSKELDKKEPTQ